METPSAPLASVEKILQDLRAHHELCAGILSEVEREHLSLKNPDAEINPKTHEIKKILLVRLTESLDKLKGDRQYWQSLNTEERERNPEIPALLRQNQDVMMKVMVLSGENEQALLRRGMVPPKHHPSANRQRPHFVAELYRKSGAT